MVSSRSLLGWVKILVGGTTPKILIE